MRSDGFPLCQTRVILFIENEGFNFPSRKVTLSGTRITRGSHEKQKPLERIPTCPKAGPTSGAFKNRRLGGAQPGNRFVSFVRAYARSGCLVELDQKFCWPAFSLFPFCWARSWGFSFVGPGGFGELSLFPFGPGSFPFSLSEIEVKSK